MPARVSEAFVIQTYPLQESDLIVSFLARDMGKMRGVAKRARRPKSPFGAGLERLSRVRLSYFQKETRELVSLDGCELMQSQFGLASDYESGVALDFLAEISEQLLPAGEPNEKFFRLLGAVLEQLRSGKPGSVWLSTMYFALWALRLSGLLPDLHACLSCGGWLEDPEAPARAFFGRGANGFYCQHCRSDAGIAGAPEISLASRALAARML
jgi:DNA repair protein RecO (recombination protein O)